MMALKQSRVWQVCFCVLFLASSLFAEEYISVINPPGAYDDNISLVLQTTDQEIRIFYRFLLDNGRYGPWIEYQNSIELTAVNGEEARYDLSVGTFRDYEMLEERELSYLIDKKRPFPPLSNTPGGEYTEDITLSFLNKEQGTIVYSINSLVVETGKEWKGEDLFLTGNPGTRNDYTIQAYTLDQVQNRSDIITYHYIINNTPEASSSPVMDIKSPLQGTFVNEQLLYISSENLIWIKYTIDGTDPELAGLFYTEPILIEKTGKVTLKVVGMPRLADSFPIKEEITFHVVPRVIGPIQVNKPAGEYYTDTQVVLSAAAGTLFHYSLNDHPPSRGDMVTKGEVILGCKENEKVFMPLRFSEIKSGEATGLEYRYFYCINKKRPVITRMTVTGGGPESLFAEVTIRGTKDSLIVYTLDGTIPDINSLVYTKPFRITRNDAYPSGQVLVSVRAFDPVGNNASSIMWRNISFLPDYPQIPQITLSPEGKTNTGVIMSIEEQENIVYEISTDNSEPPDPSRESEKAFEDILFSLPYGMEKKYIVKCAATDRDFITVSPPTRFEFTIDRLPPQNPVIQGVPVNGYTRDQVILYISGTDMPVYYQLTSAGSEPALDSHDSLLYTGPIILPAMEEDEKTYRIKALSLDDIQNVSFSLFERIFTIDTLKPSPLPPPAVRISGEDDASLYSVSWDIPGDGDIYYTMQDINGNALPGEQEYLAYKKPFNVDFSKKSGGIIVKGFIQDYAGNKSDPASFKLDPTRKKSNAPAITGVVDDGYYNKEITLELRAGEGTIYYELTDNSTNPPRITNNSSAYKSPLVLDVPYGQEKEFRLRACVIEDDVWNITSKELFIRFHIDKIPPEPPRIIDIEDKGYYYKSTTAGFSPTEDSIYYEIIPAHKYSNIIVPQEFTLYKKDIVLDTPPGSVGDFIILAFAVDRAGNLSKERPQWRVCIDKNNIFVSPEGSDLDEGTQKYPFATINKAIDYSYLSGRKQIMLAHGLFLIQKGVTIAHDISILGGFNPFTWDPGGPGDLTIIDSSPHYIYTGFPIDHKGSVFSLAQLEFRDTQKIFPGFIKSTGGTLQLEEVTFLMENKFGLSALVIENGTGEIRASEFRCVESQAGSSILARKSNLYITSSEFRGPDRGGEFTALKVNEGKECMIQDVSISPGQAKITRGAAIEDSRVLFNDCRIDTGVGSHNAVGMSLKRSVVNIQMCVLNSNKDSEYSIGISSETSKLTIDSTIINVNGACGATGIRVKDGLVNLFLNTIKSSPIPDFLYLFDLKNEKGSFVGNMITGSDSRDAMCGILTNSDSRWINNTIVYGSGPEVSSAFIINGDTTPEFINNIITRSGEPAGNAFHFIGGTKVKSTIAYNNFSGWKNILKIDFVKGDSSQFTSNPSREFYKESIDILNSFDGDPLGGYIHGNISEPFGLIFRDPENGDFHLSPSSACINRGMNVSHYIFSGIVMDIDGEERPAAGGGRKPVFDIGADEYYEDIFFYTPN